MEDDVITRKMDITDFTNIEIDCAFKLEINHAETYSVSIITNERLFDNIVVTKSGNTLKVSLKPLSFAINPPQKLPTRLEVCPILEARITTPVLNKLRLAAATKGTVKGFSDQPGFDLNLSGASDLDIDIEVSQAKLEVSGASRVGGRIKASEAEFLFSGASSTVLSGSTETMVLNAWGASQLDMRDFGLNDASIHLKQASQAILRATGQLDLNLSGASRLNYSGNPKLRNVNMTGDSTLKRVKGTAKPSA